MPYEPRGNLWRWPRPVGAGGGGRKAAVTFWDLGFGKCLSEMDENASPAMPVSLCSTKQIFPHPPQQASRFVIHLRRRCGTRVLYPRAIAYAPVTSERP